MRRMMRMVVIALLSSLFAANATFAGEIMECIGRIKHIDREKGEMVLQEIRSPKSTGVLITISDNDRQVMRKNKSLAVYREVVVTYEKLDDKNIIKRIRLVPMCDG